MAITVTGIVAVLAAHATNQQDALTVGGTDPGNVRMNQVLVLITVALVALAAVNAVFVTWATALDSRHTSALARALGATPQQVSIGLAAAQMLPALVGAASGHRRGPRTLRRSERRRDREPAALAVARRGTRDPGRDGGAHHDPCAASGPAVRPRRCCRPNLREAETCRDTHLRLIWRSFVPTHRGTGACATTSGSCCEFAREPRPPLEVGDERGSRT